MTILMIGGTGRVGSLVVQELADRGASARVLTTDPDKARLPAGMTAAKGDLLDPASMREALNGIETMFMLNAVLPAELTQALIALDLAKEAGVGHVVYISQIKLDWPDCPHAVAKASAEALIHAHDLQATILRPAYFFQNDLGLKKPILAGAYPIPIGDVGAEMVDIRDIAAVAAIAILDKDAVGPDEVIELVGPDNITGNGAAAIWSGVTGRSVTYAGDEIGRDFEQRTAATMPAWQAHDLVAMFRGCQREGMRGKPGAAERLVKLLGRPLRRYSAFAAEAHSAWQND